MGLNTILKAIVDGVKQEVYPKTYGDNVYLDDKTTLTPKIAEIIASLNRKAKDTDVMDIKIKYDGTTANSPGDAVREQISEVKSDLVDLPVSYLRGVTPLGNLIPYFITLKKEGFYVVGNVGNKISFNSNASYTTYRVSKVDRNKVYYFGGSRFVRVTDVNDVVLYASSTNISSIDMSTIEGAYNLYIASPSDSTHYISTTNSICQKARIEWLEEDKIKSNYYKMDSTTVSANTDTFIDFINSNKTGFDISFSGDISDFNIFEIGMYHDVNTKAYVKIDTTNVTIYNAYGTSEIKTHGLVISNNISVNIQSKSDAKCEVLIMSNGEIFTFETGNLVTFALWKPYINSSTNVSNANFTFTNNNLNKNVWLFGDSYFGFDPSRWMYYFINSQYKNNALIDAYAGERGTYSIQSFRNMCKIGKPKYAVWCLGMNDGSDGDNISTLWMESITSFITTCDGNNIEPILSTVPTVPNINHEKKNEWVRNSGYQYIDFAKAVGATSNGTWFDGMLYSDMVHPTEKGARALYTKFLTDFPQIKITN